jgi:capsule polysaccharide export protein KpsE/RkpR
MKEELKSLPVKELGLGIVIGLIIGIAVGYAVTPKVDITQFEQRISELEGQVTNLQNEVENKSTQIDDWKLQVSEKESQISELQSEVETKKNQTMALQVQVNKKNSEIAALENLVEQLQSQLVELRQMVSPYTEGEWNLVGTFQGSSGLTTDYFYVAGPELLLNWSWTSSVEEYAEFNVYIYRKGETAYTEACMSLGKNETTRIHDIEPGYYYLKIVQANLDQWNITVEVWIPE